MILRHAECLKTPVGMEGSVDSACPSHSHESDTTPSELSASGTVISTQIRSSSSPVIVKVEYRNKHLGATLNASVPFAKDIG